MMIATVRTKYPVGHGVLTVGKEHNSADTLTGYPVNPHTFFHKVVTKAGVVIATSVPNDPNNTFRIVNDPPSNWSPRE